MKLWAIVPVEGTPLKAPVRMLELLAQPATPHAAVALNLGGIFWKYLKGKRCKVFGEVDVFLDEENHHV